MIIVACPRWWSIQFFEKRLNPFPQFGLLPLQCALEDAPQNGIVVRQQVEQLDVAPTSAAMWYGWLVSGGARRMGK